MRPQTDIIQLDRTNKLSYSQFSLLTVVLLLASKVSTLPSVVADAAGSKSVWAILLLFAVECVALFFAMKVARQGGLFRIDAPKWLKITFAVPFLLFFLLKLSAFTREISTYYALSLFENAPVLPISAILLLFVAVYAHKGYASLGRVAEIFLWLSLFVFLFVIIFTKTEGHLFNALAILSPDFDKLGDGMAKALAWYGDVAVVLFIDLSGNDGRVSSPAEEGTASSEGNKQAPKSKKKRILFIAIALSFLSLVTFYVVFTSVYGDAAKMTDYAFIKLSAFKANTDELGAADWPMITLWAIFSSTYLALLLLSGKECIEGIRKEVGKNPAHSKVTPGFIVILSLLLSVLLLDETTRYKTFMTNVMSIVTGVALSLTVTLGAIVLYRDKEKRNEETK